MAKKINKTKLQKLKKNELVQLAETNGITGAKAFKKQELIDRLSTLAQKKTPTASIHKPARKLRGKSIPTVPIHEVIIVNESKVSQESDYGIGLPPVSEQSSCDEGRGLPFSYNTTKLVAMVRDPEWAYTYWDFDGDTYNKITYLFREKSNTIKPILRVYEITGIEFDGTACNYSWDIDVHLDAKSWYVRLGDDNKVYVLDLGLLGDDNTFYLIARSNIIRTPLAGPSDVIDEEWMLIDIDELYYTRDWNDSISSAGFRKRKRAQEWLSSGAISSPIKKAKKSK